MTNNTVLARSMVIYAICLPLAIILGYIITDPLRGNNPIALSLVFFFLVLPLLLRWYHAWLIVIWNIPITLIYLPGTLPAWMPIACVGLVVAAGHYILNRDRKFLYAPSVSWSLIFIALVVLITAKFRGGLGFRALGSETIGAKRYLWIWISIVGYFVLISQPIPTQKRRIFASLFILASGTAVISFLSQYMGPARGIVNIFFPSMDDPNQIQASPMVSQNLERFSGISLFCGSLGYAVVARYGIEGSLDLAKIWRLLVLLVAIVASFFGGFRTQVIMVGMVLALTFIFEGLVRTRLMPIFVLGAFLMGGLTVTFSDRMPLPVQRCLALFPLKLDPVAKLSAQASSDWRLDIWRNLLPQIPQYLLLGKGLTFDANDLSMYMSLGNSQVGGEIGGGFTLASDYHNGPLSLIIPFGIWGCIGFIWFLVAAIRALWANYKYGDPEIKTINTFLLSYFVAKVILFFFVFGGFYADMVGFAGLIGLSISLNAGVAKPVPAEARAQVVFNRFRRLPIAQAEPVLEARPNTSIASRAET